MINIVDSSAWLAYFADSTNARHFASIIEDTDSLVVPSITIYEVFKKILRERDETTALQVIAHMRLGTIIDLDTDIALLAARVGTEYKIPMADSIILATAQRYEATLWTQDSDFKGIPNVQYVPKR